MANFCKYCGKVLQDGEICSCPQAQAEAAGSYAQGPQQPPPNYNQQYQPPQPPPYQQYAQPMYDPFDHTAEFDPKDISDNKVFAMLVYLMGTIGIIIALLASHASPYTMFHVRQGLKITVVNMLLAIVVLVLFWTVLVPIVCGIMFVVLFVVNIICFFQVCSGKAKEPAIVCKLGFLR